ncbi:sugar O-acetyltransferase [Sphingobium naphthae]|uniref:Sugar O-acetyltransferase n=1 Tax=Sphingobium naphthae TaxID=1886786 RepID=A0ABU3ZRQ7_9SPHN|nr:sugar O-acetyltransferase [Sphingobium naphthae]MDV5822199.1 sugar O-acetyltransferase [Sphingobium naphthae]
MSERSMKQRMIAGEPYRADDPEIIADQLAAAAWMRAFNATLPPEREALLRERLGAVGAGSTIRPPFHCDYGFNIFLGEGVFLNFNCVILDVVEVSIGDGTQIGTGVQILTADHPRDAVERAAGLEWGRPIRIGRNVWIGGGAIILPGVTVGDDALIGAGSVVTRDVPAGATVVGNPARPR